MKLATPTTNKKLLKSVGNLNASLNKKIYGKIKLFNPKLDITNSIYFSYLDSLGIFYQTILNSQFFHPRIYNSVSYREGIINFV